MKRTILQGIRVGDVMDVPEEPGTPDHARGSKTIDFIHPDGAEIFSVLLFPDDVEELTRRLGGDTSKVEIHRTMPPPPPQV